MTTMVVAHKVLCYFAYYDADNMGPYFDSRMIEVHTYNDIEREFELVVSEYAATWNHYRIGRKPKHWNLLCVQPYSRQ